jgi:hypothetical protein
MSRVVGGNSGVAQVARQKNKEKTKTKTETKTEEKKEVMPSKGGVRIGDNQDSGKWRCRTCKHLNSIY